MWLCHPVDCSTPGLPVHHQLLVFTQTHVHWVSDAIQPSHPLSSPSPPTFNLSQIRVFSNESALHIEVTKVLEFQLQHQSVINDHSGLIFFRMDWLHLLAVQGTLKSPPTPQLKSSNSSVLSFLHSPTLTSIHDYCKNHSLDETDLCWQSNVSAFNMLSRLVITSPPRSKCLLSSWLL